MYNQKSRQPALFKPKGRDVPDKNRLFLFVRAGGRCEFDGCNRYLLEHHLTKIDGIFAQMAHIWAFSPRGPRGRKRPGKTYVHAVSNLILLCSECHKLVDDHHDQFTVSVLQKHKKAHEDRVFMLTETKPDRQTIALIFKARIGGRTTSVSLSEIQEAVAPRYLNPRDMVTIDLTDIPDSSKNHFWNSGKEAVRLKTRALYEHTFESGPARHLSVFALGPIPLLVFLGTCLSDKVPLSLYQRHRDTENWRWKAKGEVVSYDFQKLRHGRDPASVALLLSLSGRIREDDLPEGIDNRFTLYEITLAGIEPTPRFLDLEESLRAFQDVFLRAIRHLVSSHQRLERLHLFPAVPAPLAVAIGRDLMPKRDPALLVYDYDKRAGGFVQTLEVNKNEPQ